MVRAKQAPIEQRRHLMDMRRRSVLFLLTVAGFLAYAALFIYRTSFVVGGERYFSLFDDAMISMRYAKNLASGYGLVWNPGGERVEGYTNPLWVLYMALVHLLPLTASKVSVVVQATAAVFLTANLFVVRKIALAIAEGSEAVALGAVALTAFYLPINNWSLQGMEVSVLVLIVSLCLWRTFKALDAGSFPAGVYGLLGASTLVRPDMAVPLVGIAIFLAICDPNNRWRHLTWGFAALAVFSGVQTAFRLWYYGEILPNTYYLKLAGYPALLRISRGFFVLGQFILQANPLLFALPFIVAVRLDWRVRLLLWTFVIQLAYSIYVGGDAWEYWGGSNRYICIAMPGFFVLLSYGLFHISRAAAVALNWSQWPIGVADWLKASIFPLLIAYSIVSLNSIYGVDALAELSLVHAPLHSGGDDENSDEVEQALLLQQITSRAATIAVVRAGTIPYFSDRYSIDELGKNDKHVAHEPMRETAGLRRLIAFRPGHMKLDYAYSIGVLKPDVVVQLWEHGEEATPALRQWYTGVRVQGRCLYFRRGSANVNWEKLPDDRCGVAR
jgi:arabinofuranosyltransferase